MAELKDKVKFALDEARILILGAQVLCGFGYQAVFQPRFDRLPVGARYVHAVALTLLIIGLALLMAPAARHRIVERGECTPALHRFATRLLDWALLPFAAGLGASLFLASELLAPGAGHLRPAIAGAAAAGLALAFWYGPRLVLTPRDDSAENRQMEQQPPKTDVKEKVNHALTECRMVLPGVQAMLGFQFIAMLAEAFERLPASSKAVHAVSLGLSAVTIILLIAPAALHRMVERGEATERQHRATGRYLLAAMATLAPAIAGDLFVVLRRVTHSTALATAVAGLIAALFYGLWFVLPWAMRRRGDAARVDGAGREAGTTLPSYAAAR